MVETVIRKRLTWLMSRGDIKLELEGHGPSCNREWVVHSREKLKSKIVTYTNNLIRKLILVS